MSNRYNIIHIHVHIHIHISFSLRARFSMDGSDDNGLHGAQNELEAEKEIQYFFPKEQTVAVIKPNSVDQKGLYKCMYAYL